MTQSDVKRIVCHEEPSLDTMMAACIARRYLCENARPELTFVSRHQPLLYEEDVLWCVGSSAPLFSQSNSGGKKRKFAERYAASATGTIWAKLQSIGRPLNHLVELVDCIHADATQEIPVDPPWRSLATRLHRFWNRKRASSQSDLDLADAMCGWLDEFDRELRRDSWTPDDPIESLSQIPKAKGTYALILACHEPRTFLVGRTGNRGRMTTRVGYYVYLGSALGGLRGREKHHLTPADQLRAKWQVDSLRLVTSLEEIWYTASEYPWECRWAECMLTMPKAELPGPRKFGATGCDGKCITHLPFFPDRPSVEEFQQRLNRRNSVGCLVERLVLREQRC